MKGGILSRPYAGDLNSPTQQNFAPTIIIPSFPLFIKRDEMMFIMCVVCGVGIKKVPAPLLLSHRIGLPGTGIACPPTTKPVGTTETTIYGLL